MDPDHLADLFAAFGPVRARRMFGGLGLFADGVMFGLVADGVIHLKCGPDDAAAFEAEGCEPFRYARAGRMVDLSYRRLPDRLLDDPDDLAVWARRALQAARRSAGGVRRGRDAPA